MFAVRPLVALTLAGLIALPVVVPEADPCDDCASEESVPSKPDAPADHPTVPGCTPATCRTPTSPLKVLLVSALIPGWSGLVDFAERAPKSLDQPAPPTPPPTHLE